MIAAASSADSRLVDVAPRLLSQVLEQCGEARIRVAGTSMLPSIRPGDILHIRSASISKVHRDDVILFESGRRLFAHRVVQVDSRGAERVLITRGDMHSHDDPPVTEAQLLGRVEGRVRGGIVTSTALAPWRLRPGRRASLWFKWLRVMRLWEQRIRSLHAPAR